MSPLLLTLAGVAIAALGALTAAGIYTEAHRLPDQP
jgi:hypothetical protein